MLLAPPGPKPEPLAKGNGTGRIHSISHTQGSLPLSNHSPGGKEEEQGADKLVKDQPQPQVVMGEQGGQSAHRKARAGLGVAPLTFTHSPTPSTPLFFPFQSYCWVLFFSSYF